MENPACIFCFSLKFGGAGPFETEGAYLLVIRNPHAQRAGACAAFPFCILRFGLAAVIVLRVRPGHIDVCPCACACMSIAHAARLCLCICFAIGLRRRVEVLIPDASERERDVISAALCSGMIEHCPPAGGVSGAAIHVAGPLLREALHDGGKKPFALRVYWCADNTT